MKGSREPRATATVAVRVAVAPDVAFTAFTAELDRWWRRGPKYRHGTGPGAVIRIEPQAGGRVYEAWDEGGKRLEITLGTVLVFEPPRRLVYTWRNATMSPLEDTEVEVTFAGSGGGTLVTVRHSGWEALRSDHPARHGLDDVGLARSVGLWWGEQLSALREHASVR